MKIANKNAREHVEKLTSFKGSNLSADWETPGWYVVKSYGWYPILAYCKKRNKWFENKDKYSVSTSRQLSNARPYEVHVEPVAHTRLKELISRGE